MKLLLTFLSGMLIVSGIYDLGFDSIEGQHHVLSEYQAQKIWVVVLPATQTADDTAYLQRVDSIALAHAGTVKTIAVPSYEDGYADSLSTTLQPFYRNFLDTQIVITQGMYTHQSSTGQQNLLFNWLTHVSRNTHFEQEVGGPGEMYFINEQGELNGVFGPEAKWSNKVINRLLP